MYLTLVFEFTIITYFIYRIRSLYISKRKREFAELLSSALFGLTLEYLNIFINDNYHYSTLFLLQIGSIPTNVPIAIALGWGLIITSCVKITNNFIMPHWIKPGFDALLALSIDLSMDVIAIRIDGGFWHWQVPLLDYPTDLGFYGVPIGNFTSWFYVVIIYSIILRYGRNKFTELTRNYKFYLVTMPIIAYIPLFILILGSISIYFFLGLRGVFNVVIYQLLVIILYGGTTIFVFILSIVKNRSSLHLQLNIDTLPLFLIFHLYFLLAYLFLRLHSRMPFILNLGLGLFLLDLILHCLRTQSE